jgi:hypothetical protein
MYVAETYRVNFILIVLKVCVVLCFDYCTASISSQLALLCTLFECTSPACSRVA